MSKEEKRKNIIKYYLTITTGIAFGFINSSIIFFISIKHFGIWWSYPGLFSGVLGSFYGFVRLKVDYGTLRHSLNNL